MPHVLAFIVRLGVTACLLAVAGAASAFDLDDVAKKAQALAAKPYQAPVIRMPAELRDLDYDQYRDIRFRADKAVWRNEKLPFELMMFHQGRAVTEPVAINLVEPAGVRALAFNPSLFDYGKNKLDPAKLKDVGFNGFRVHYALNSPQYKDELIVFQGASYFRSLGKGHHYGLSARGLAVDTAAASGEEFPRFVEFWIEKPRPRATSLTIYAMLDSKRVTGAYRFVVTPGVETVMHVRARLFVRDRIEKIGIAPLTSMFTFGENQPGRDDFRPEVHDSDGLSIQSESGEWIWRPLVNPRRLLVTSFSLTDPKGFGLMQRDRNPASYEDPEALYEKRPSLWVEPEGGWGPGRVELVQIPTPDETNDNIVAFWVPQQPLQTGRANEFAYRLRWQGQGMLPKDLAYVLQTRRGHGFMREPTKDIHYVVDFDGAALRALKSDQGLEPVVWTDSNAELRERNLFRNRVNGTWRMTLRLRRLDANKPVELRGYIQRDQKPFSETWSYVVPAEPEKP